MFGHLREWKLSWVKHKLGIGIGIDCGSNDAVAPLLRIVPWTPTWMDGWMDGCTLRSVGEPFLRNINWPLLPPLSHQAALWAE